MNTILSDEVDDGMDFENQRIIAAPQVFPGNKRSRLDVEITRPVTSMAVTGVTSVTSSEELSQNRSMSYYEVPTHRNTIAYPPPPPNTSLPPIPQPGNQRRFYSTVTAPSSQSRLV